MEKLTIKEIAAIWARQLKIEFSLSTAEKNFVFEFVASILKDLKQGSKITRGDIWGRAAIFTGKPKILPENLFLAVRRIAEPFPRFKFW